MVWHSSDSNDEGSQDGVASTRDKVPPAGNDTTTNNEDANGTTNGDAEVAYAEHRSGMMVMAEENGVRATTMVREMVRNDLFRLIKFITKDEELGLYGKSAAFIAKRMSVKVDDPGFGKLWRSQKKTVKKTLDSKRSTTSMAVKQVVIRKWLPRVSTIGNGKKLTPPLASFVLLSGMSKANELCSLEEFLAMRENKKAFSQFCDHILPCIVGRTRWDKHVEVVRVSKIATTCDEAWGLLLLENSWDLWNQMAADRLGLVEPSDRLPTKWTHTTGTARRNEGWGDKGIPRFNELIGMIKADRAKNQEVEEDFKAAKEDALHAKMAAGKRKRVSDENGSGEVKEAGLDSFAEEDLMFA
jgi:hypothetical protein